MKRYLCGLLTVLATPALAQAISGTAVISASAPSKYGTVDVTATINLQCSLTCPSSAPTLHFGIAGLADFLSTGDPSVKVGYLSVGFATGVDPTGTSTTTVTNMPAGASFALVAKSATCACGNRTGEGGYIDVISNTLSLDPFINEFLLFSSGEVGKMSAAVVGAFPTGGEVVTVSLKGAGLDQTVTVGANDCDSSHNCKVPLTPTAPGDLVVTATTAQGKTATRTFTIAGVNGGSGGGGTSGAGGGSGGGDVPADPGCTQVPGGLVWSALALLATWRRRRA